MSRQPPDVWIWGFKNIGLLCIKPPYFCLKKSDVFDFRKGGVFWWGDCRDIDTTIVMVSFCGGPATARRLSAGEVDGLFFFFTADILFDVRWWGGYKPSPPPIMYNYALFVVLHMRAQNLHTRAQNQYYGWCRLFSEAFWMLRIGAS